MSFFSHAFDAPIERHDVGRYAYTVVFLPDAIAADLPFDAHPRLRIEAEVADRPVSGAWQPAGGRWYLMLPRGFLKDADLAPGDDVEVRFRIADQKAVDVPADLAEALRRDPSAAAAWDRLTAGRRRAWAHRVASAKRAPTRQARIAEVLAVLKGERPDPMARASRRARPPA